MISITNINEDKPTDYNNILKQISNEKKLKKNINTLNPKIINNVNNFDNIDVICYDCKSRNLFELDGYYVCKNCGLYNDCIINCGQEWRNYGAEDSKGTDQSRCDIPTNDLLPKTSIGSLVGFSTRENKTSKRIRNMNHWNSIPYRESSLLETFNNITIMSQNSGINQCIIEDAKSMYKKVTDIKSSRRTKKEAMKAGCIMLACKLNGVPRNCSEIATIFKLKNNKTFRKSIKTFEEIWNNIQLTDNDISAKIKLDIGIDKKLKDKNRNKINNNNSIERKSYSKKGSESNSGSDSDSDSGSDSDSDSDSGSDSDSESDSEINSKKNSNSFIKINNNYMKNENYIKPINKPINNTINDIKSIETIDTIYNNEKVSKQLHDCITKLHRFSCILGFDDKTFEACRIILTYIENEKYLDKHTPLSRTSVVIYYIIERLGITSINKNQILQTCEISDVTINKCYQKIMKYKKEMSQINIFM